LAKVFRLLLAGLLAAALAVLAFVAAAEFAQGRREAAAAAAAPPGERIEVGDGAIFVQRFGPPDKPPVVIVPGTAAWSGFWAGAAQAIAGAGFSVVAVDVPPFGYSDRPPGGDYSRAAQAARLAALIDRLGLKRPIVLAHSFGAGAAVELALRSGDKLGGLLLVDGALALPVRGATPTDPVWLKAALARDSVTRALTDCVLVNPWLTHRLLAGLLARPEAATAAVVETLQRPYRRAGTSAAYARWLPSLLLADHSALSADPAAYGGLGLPVALIWGGDDHVTPLAQGERLRDLIPGATLDVLPGVGHIPHIEDPDAFAAAAIRRLTQMTRMNRL
jgi:pimeloyl-ACP methyl ester carboxylesterase